MAGGMEVDPELREMLDQALPGEMSIADDVRARCGQRVTAQATRGAATRIGVRDAAIFPRFLLDL